MRKQLIRRLVAKTIKNNNTFLLSQRLWVPGILGRAANRLALRQRVLHVLAAPWLATRHVWGDHRLIQQLLPAGNKQELVEALSNISKIDKTTLLDASNLSNVLIARRIFWAAERRTTRIEERDSGKEGAWDVIMFWTFEPTAPAGAKTFPDWTSVSTCSGRTRRKLPGRLQ
ncbi:hypothetical protein V8F06_011720 [Rhypophila decipiens]